ncbi:Fur family transcriptional regulator [Nocardiopsis sp. CNT312]|uniref:Fur family transcriptional regulator n=1 Tax=Nocardiopsis sp. CNT312 TaxID=1137268 RepID=UPI00048A7427|nr:transcriptional repressor [Nocardiopsis sp. CNT312]
MARTPRNDALILEVLGRNRRFRSCQEVHIVLVRRSSGQGKPPSLSTVYRALHRLVREGLLDTIRSPDGELLYRLCRTSDRHHHLMCRLCGRVEDVPQAEELSAALDRIGGASGFGGLDYTFELSGVCPRCS